MAVCIAGVDKAGTGSPNLIKIRANLNYTCQLSCMSFDYNSLTEQSTHKEGGLNNE